MDERGAAAVEYTALIALVALLAIAALGAMRAHPEAGDDTARLIGRRIACAPSLPGPCHRDPLTAAYGRALGGAIRAAAARPLVLSGLLPVDFRRCRTPACARPGRDPGLTASGRRVTLFVSAVRVRGRGATVTFWSYRPSLGWREDAIALPAATVRAGERVPLPEDAVPRLIPLETLDGRNHVAFDRAEEPPWRWRVSSR